MDIEMAPPSAVRPATEWRAICFSTPEFWSALSVATRKIEQEGVKASGYDQLMGQWFARSGSNAFLELDFLEDQGMAPMALEDRKEVVRLILEASATLEIPFWDTFAKAPTDQWRLETLVLFEYQLIERLRPAGISIEDGKANPLNQITTLKNLSFATGLENLKLETCTHLVTLSIKMPPNNDARWPDQYPQHPISLPHLKSFTLDAEELELLSHLHCRALTDFHLLTRVPLPRQRRRAVAVPPQLKPPVLADF
ncbi:hypothetical protein BKA70DRAFT_1219879 [Coprinopsis sp. MPI-PUGE-AT-0042]|nr:hypothetical protein BKA70DRAFT_1219879 [Coprinopsis sp. MPI-PUGE-AT-0042]